MSTNSSLYWYDLETFGLDSKYHRIAQFAGVRTDMDLNIIEDPLVMYCKPSQDFLPDPTSCMITGITPQLALEKGIGEYEFVEKIFEKFSTPNTCVAGYNNIRFDDEFMRYAFYRNLFDPYEREWRDNNSRWDIMDLVRACYTLRPAGVNWPFREDGIPSFKLEELTVANNISHEHAHDAYSDVVATINMAKLIKQKQPKLYDYVFNHRDKHSVARYLDTVRRPAVLHISGMYKSANGCMAVVMPVVKHPINKNGIVVLDLSYDPTQLDQWSVEEMRDLIYSSNEDLPEGASRIPVKTIHLNRCPFVAPINTLNEDICKQYNIDLNQCYNNRQIILTNKSISDKLRKIFAEKKDYGEQDADESLYNGFFSSEDKATLTQVRASSEDQLRDLALQFSDDRLTELVYRFRARNYPNSLSDEEKSHWHDHRIARLQGKAGDVPLTLDDFTSRIAALRENSELSEKHQQVLNHLEDYARVITQK